MIIELASHSTVRVSTPSTSTRLIYLDTGTLVMMKEGISMETPNIVVSIEISRTRPQLKQN